MRGRVHEAGGGVYHVRLEDQRDIEASLRGRLKRQQRTGSRVVIGDVVTLGTSGDAWTIESVDDRSTELVRRGQGGRAPKLLAANLDKAFMVIAAKNPDATVELIDRLLMLGEASGMHPVLIINKLDVPGAPEVSLRFAPMYRAVGYEVLSVSAETGEGIEFLRSHMCEGTSTLIGPSGVGKSSLLNAVDPELGLRIGELSRKTRTGRHTTVSSRIISLTCGGLVADTPGFGDVTLWGVTPEEVAGCFPEFAEPADHCRFRGCTHTHEPDCGVKSAVEAGEIFDSRYKSYLTAREEAGEAR
ncbi:MAG: ribosome small subunit-dependent GTPase A [Gemmatimonadota bacterium]|nr:ribosome small subunit-dependent GTPase A [Gemmatimonadota bacterium]